MDWLWELLASPVIGNIFLLVAAIVGVVGSYCLYRNKVKDTREQVRQGLKNELESMIVFEKWNYETTPAQKVGSSFIYEQNAENVGLLTDSEINLITRFYTQLDMTQNLIDDHREANIAIGLKENAVNSSRYQRELVLKQNFVSLFIARWKAIEVIKRNLGEEYRDPDLMNIDEGNQLSEEHPLIEQLGDPMEEEGYIEANPDGTYQITESGREFLGKSRSASVDYSSLDLSFGR